MKGGKDDEKIGIPMFPRLHVNDTDKGGPRAPPRNKMALYEQLSIPLQRFNSSSLPHPLQDARNLGAPSSQGNGHEGTVFSPFYVSSLRPGSLAENANSRFLDGESIRATKMEFEKKSTRHVDSKSANVVSLVAECSSRHQRNSTNEKDSCQNRVDDNDDDDFRVPTFVNSENVVCLNKDANGVENKRKTPHANGPQNDSDRLLEQTSVSDVKSRKNERKCRQQKLDNTVDIEILAEKSLLHPEAGDKLAKPSRFSKPFSDWEPASSHGLCRESCGGSIAQSESQSKGPLGERTVDMRDTHNQKSSDKENRSLEQQDADDDEDSETSMVDSDSVSGLEISPDDVVGMIGERQFWKARRAIVNQQRVFAVQVFELHRLIKVQKLLAASPQLLEQNSRAAPQKVPGKNQHLEPYAKPQPQSVKQKDDSSQKPSQNTDSHVESTGARPLPSYNEAIKKASTFPPAHEIRSNPWCYPPPQHQWLVPVMSPSEGLIYKPCSAPCPPPTGFVTPVYGNYNPMSLPSAYQIHSYPQQNYYPNLYGQMISNSVVDQTSPMIVPRPNVHTQQSSRSSCNMSFPKSDPFPDRNLKARTSKDVGLQRSGLSSPSVRAGGDGRDALPLFPVGSMLEGPVNASDSNCEGHQTRVIRVVPHNNVRSATESAARIFRSIQKGRQHLD